MLYCSALPLCCSNNFYNFEFSVFSLAVTTFFFMKIFRVFFFFIFFEKSINWWTIVIQFLWNIVKWRSTIIAYHNLTFLQIQTTFYKLLAKTNYKLRYQIKEKRIFLLSYFLAFLRIFFSENYPFSYQLTKIIKKNNHFLCVSRAIKVSLKCGAIIQYSPFFHWQLFIIPYC